MTPDTPCDFDISWQKRFEKPEPAASLFVHFAHLRETYRETATQFSTLTSTVSPLQEDSVTSYIWRGSHQDAESPMILDSRLGDQ